MNYHSGITALQLWTALDLIVSYDQNLYERT